MFWIRLLRHFLADYPLQSNAIVQTKDFKHDVFLSHNDKPAVRELKRLL